LKLVSSFPSSQEPSVTSLVRPRAAAAPPRRLLIGSLLAGLFACGGDATGPSGAALPIDLASDMITLTELGATATVTATVGGEPVTVGLALVPDGETRWNSELAVASRASNVVTATGAGTIRFAVTAANGIPGEVSVSVAPNRPYLIWPEGHASAGPDAPLLLHGFGVESLEPEMLVVGEDHPSIEVLDSARVHLRFPPLTGATCGGNTMPLVAEPEGVDLIGVDQQVIRPHAADRSLAVGETLTLTADDADCLRLGAGEYMAVFYDARLIYPKQPHPYVKAGEFSVVVSDYSAGAPTQHASMIMPMARAADHDHPDKADVVLAGEDWPGWWLLTEPAEVGDTLNYTTSEAPRGVVVLAVVDGHQIITTPLDSVVPQVTLGGIVALVEYFNAQHRPWLEGLYGVVPSGNNGQYLINIIPMDNAGVSGFAGVRSQTLRIGNHIWDPRQGDGGFGDAGLYWMFGHEYTHSYHAGYQIAQGTSGWSGTTIVGRELWQVEGLADHIGYRMGAERAGIQIGANQLRSEWGFLNAFVRFNGQIERGYRPAALKLWDFADRLAAATGMTWDAAHDSVSLAVAHNRWGCLHELSPEDPGNCEIYDGLYDMMQRNMPAGWDPVDAILLFALSQAADDLTDNPAVQNPHFRSTGDYGTMSSLEEFRMVGYEGQAKEWGYATGAVGRLRLGLGDPGAFKLDADIEGLRWKLIRVQ
jgi:hypothetical protein